jgi:GT2 family glycosyltransferase
MICVVIVNWNGRADTLECLESLARCSVDMRVLVVDNGSEDGSIEAFERWARGEIEAERSSAVWDLLPGGERRPITLSVSPRYEHAAGPMDSFVTVIAAGANLGFAGANNVGIERALADPACRYVWILNNDTVVEPETPARLVQRMTVQPSLGVLGGTLLFYHQPRIVQSVGSRWQTALARGGAIHSLIDRSQLPEQAVVEQAIDYVAGASMFVSREFVETVGPMSEDYFLYYEELDWMRRMGGRFELGWCPDAVLYHKEGASIGTSTTARPSDTSLYYYYVNMFRFYHKFHIALLPVSWARWGWDALRYWRAGDKSAVETMRLALADAASGRKRTGKIVIGAANDR